MTRKILNFRAVNRAALTCVWIATGDPGCPLICKWIVTADEVAGEPQGQGQNAQITRLCA